MSLTKGIFVRHPKDEIYKKWGVGIVLDDERGNQVNVFFEHELKRKTIGTNYVQLLEVNDPGKSTLLLQNALYEDTSDRQPFPLVLERFLLNFPGGLKGDLYLSEERNYKLEASDFARKLLVKDRFRKLLDNKDWETLSTDLKRIYSKTNLLASFEMIKLNDALKKEDDILDVANVFFDLLYGDANVSQRLESASTKLVQYEINKWPVITYLLFLVFPKEYMFVKPTVTKEAAANRGFDIQYESKVNANTYKQILLFSQELFDRLNDDKREELHPIDMIDVQGFMWCTFAKGWTAEELQKAKDNLNN